MCTIIVLSNQQGIAMSNLIDNMKLASVTNDLQLANLVIETFIEKAELQNDLNQITFNKVIVNILKTANFSGAFAKLLVKTKFERANVLKTLDPSSCICVLDIYSVDEDGIGNYTDETLVDDVMYLMLERSTLMLTLLNQAWDHYHS
jgi:hypothetical protein